MFRIIVIRTPPSHIIIRPFSSPPLLTHPVPSCAFHTLLLLLVCEFYTLLSQVLLLTGTRKGRSICASTFSSSRLLACIFLLSVWQMHRSPINRRNRNFRVYAKSTGSCKYVSIPYTFAQPRVYLQAFLRFHLTS